jgi:hypothetical protein
MNERIYITLTVMDTDDAIDGCICQSSFTDHEYLFLRPTQETIHFRNSLNSFKCKRERIVGGRYCKYHTCAFKPCTNLRYTDAYCTVHMCKYYMDYVDGRFDFRNKAIVAEIESHIHDFNTMCFVKTIVEGSGGYCQMHYCSVHNVPKYKCYKHIYKEFNVKFNIFDSCQQLLINNTIKSCSKMREYVQTINYGKYMKYNIAEIVTTAPRGKLASETNELISKVGFTYIKGINNIDEINNKVKHCRLHSLCKECF